MINRLRQPIESAFWALLILMLPFTSLPLLSRLAGGTMVAPASIIPLFVLILIFLLPVLLRGCGLPAQTVALLAFALAAILSSGLSFFIDIPIFREVNRLNNTLSALVTAAIGIGFYLLAAAWTDSTDKLARIYFWVNISGLVIILWSLLQAVIWFTSQAYPDWLYQIQAWVSSSGNLYNRRVTGLAFEPSWLGHQLVLLYLPYWLAATVRRTTAVPLRLWGLSMENVLLALGAGVLVLAFSRSAVISFVLMLSLLLIQLTKHVVRSIQRKLHISTEDSKPAAIRIRLAGAAIWAGVIILYLALMAGLVFAATRLDTRMADLFTLLQRRLSFTELAYNLIFGERVIFWNAGLEVFSDHPIFGVGLGNAGFFFPEKINAYGWTVVEPFKIYYSSSLPNTLNLWVRLLAETGVLGFGVMLSWLVILWKSARYVQAQSDPILRTTGLAGQLALVALLMEGMSVDTLAFPYFWLTFGWLTAAAEIIRRRTPSRQWEPAAQLDI